jgi:hypothetical protein
VPTSVARVITQKPSPYLSQLCKHFRHNISDTFSVEFTDESGEIRYRSPEHGVEVVVLDASAPDLLLLTASCDKEEGLDDIQGWVGSHLVQFGKRDELTVDWVRQ